MDASLLPGSSAALLRRNLAALQRAAPRLAARLRLPVDGAHVVAVGAALRLVVHRSAHALELAPELVRARTQAVAGAEAAFVFGVGLGELVAALVARGVRVVAWERDPWLLRLALARHDLARALERGRLALALGADLVRVEREARTLPRVEHPLLARLYASEHALLARGIGPRRALLASGGLFVDALERALGGEGYSVFRVGLAQLAAEELEHAVRVLSPELLALINWVDGTAEFCARAGLSCLCWEIDPAPAPPLPSAASTERVHVFTYRRANVAAWRAAGFARVEYLPLAADPDQRAPLELTDDERARYAAPLAFVGSSLVENAADFARRFLAAYARFRGGGEAALAEGQALLAGVLAEQRADFAHERVGELLEARAPEFVRVARAKDGLDPVVLAAEVAASEKRLSWAASLGRAGLDVWGDEGWRRIARHGVRYRGPAGHARELSCIYNAADVSLDIGRLYQSDIVTMRVFDALACGGFCLAEHSSALDELFDVGSEVDSYRTLDELRLKLAHWHAHPELARAMAARGRAAVVARHSIAARVRYMLARLRAGELLQAG